MRRHFETIQMLSEKFPMVFKFCLFIWWNCYPYFRGFSLVWLADLKKRARFAWRNNNIVIFSKWLCVLIDTQWADPFVLFFARAAKKAYTHAIFLMILKGIIFEMDRLHIKHSGIATLNDSNVEREDTKISIITVMIDRSRVACVLHLKSHLYHSFQRSEEKKNFLYCRQNYNKWTHSINVKRVH